MKHSIDSRNAGFAVTRGIAFSEPFAPALRAPAHSTLLLARPSGSVPARRHDVPRASIPLRSASPLSNGFTLIEILVVIAIISLLAVFIVPNVVGAQDKARDAAVKLIAHNVQLAVEAYHMENGNYPLGNNIPLESLIKNYLEAGGYMVTVPKNPYTGKPYTDQDHAGRIHYSFDITTGQYLIKAYKRNGTTESIQLSNF